MDTRPQCVACGARRLAEDPFRGELVCTECGTVNPDEALAPATRPKPASKRRKLAAPSFPTRASEAETQGEASSSELRELQQDEFADSGDDNATALLMGAPSDTMVGLQVLKGQFPRLKEVTVAPLMLNTQLYNIVKDRTEVDRTLDDLRRSKVVRLFKLPTGADDYAVVFTADYQAQINGCKQRAIDQKKPADHVSVYDWFRDALLSHCTEVSITQRELFDRIAASDYQSEADKTEFELERSYDHKVSLLVNSGLLSRQLSNNTSTSKGETFWFSIPNIGFVSKCLTNGRAEILGMLARRRYNEILQKELEKRKLTSSVLGIRFHVRDLLGGTKLESTQTTCGALLRLVKK